jgi:methyl-accepting chemotaxis protein
MSADSAQKQGGKAATSIRVQLFVLVSALVSVLVTFLVVYFAASQVRLLERTVVGKGELLAQQLRTSVAFDDKETAREVFEAAHNQPDVLHLALFRADGRLVHADGSGDLSPPAPAAEARLEALSDRMRVVAPVVSVEGPRGTLVLELDRARMAAEIRVVRLGAVGIGLIGLVVGCLAAWFVGRTLARRLDDVRRAALAVAGGDLGQPRLPAGANDEIGQLTGSFNDMVESLRSLVAKLSETSAQLEGASDSFLDIVRNQGEEMKGAVAGVGPALRRLAATEGGGDAAAKIERLIEDTKGMSDGLVPGFIELRSYAEDLNRVIDRFEGRQSRGEA